MIEPLPVIIELRRTALAMPSQWEGRTSDGLVLYVRFRHGAGQASIGPTEDDAVRAGWSDYVGSGRVLHRWDEGGDGNGFMTDFELREQLAGIVAFAPGVIQSVCDADHSHLHPDRYPCPICGASQAGDGP